MIELYNGDCLEEMKKIPDGSVDLVLTDPPYGTTACKWDTVIDIDKMWMELKRIVKPNGAIILTASEPFASKLRLSNLEMYKYDWKWKKNRPVGFVNAKLKPLKSYEDVLVFSLGKTSNGNNNNMTYNPQDLVPCNKKGTQTKSKHGQNTYHRPSHDKGYTQEYTNYPIDILEVNEKGLGKKVHPTQKPVPLMEYLVKTYTNEDDTVVDFTMGSGTTGVACKNLSRNFIGIELDEEYFQIAKERIDNS